MIKGQNKYTQMSQENEQITGESKNKLSWGEVTKLVQNSNYDELSYVKREINVRKEAYNNQLSIQVTEHRKKNQQEIHQKLKQRAQLQQKIKQDKIINNLLKLKKMKTQQKFQVQNLQLLLSKKNRLTCTDTQQQQKQKNIYIQNPFVSLVDQQESRKLQTKQNFKLQNKLNEIQLKIKNKRIQELSQEQKKIRKNFQNYVQGYYENIQKEKDKYRNKYLVFKTNQKQRYNVYSSIQQNGSAVNLQRSYREYLSNQIRQQKQKQIIEHDDIMDISLQKINKNVAVRDSSPAYLGRGIYSDDRRKQLDIVNRGLPSYNKINNIANNDKINRSMEMSERQSNKKISRYDYESAQLNRYNMMEQNPKNKLLPSIFSNQKQEQKKSRLKTSGYESIINETPVYNVEMNANQKQQTNRSVIGQNQSHNAQKGKSYKCYDLISGNRKTIII